ncbi:hypothetical protein H5410_025337 [Solanum commersonii]|uniref:Uncharacterized protein n=1 Tax=Solanum commersonii TaxID=4109 RepID=A0A9J5YVH4_SOLCO|nr:hypothetical protein H5410_025337 [Solanum commersonii]
MGKFVLESNICLAKKKKGQIFEISDQESCSNDESKQNQLMDVAENFNSSNGIEEKIKEEIENETDEELF